ncbi:MAG TPA: MBL fold metallo-hydrolase [Bacteroidia bacterium]|nr:MBL fold metallo-hydrolase [Bacteroidia bacterium]
MGKTTFLFMRIEYISHSCFVIETNDTKIAFDPWITGTAYKNQWHLFPKPIDTNIAKQADVLIISHGHEDHLHHESLKLIQKNAHVFFPFQWREGVVDYFKHLQFNTITEAVSFKTYAYKDIQITYLGYSLESIIVVECEGYVIVNINDALNSNHETAVDFLLDKIKTRWPKIDFLLSGWSGAGYFPNKVHYKAKNDAEVARIREQYFCDNFCRFTKYLQPNIAIPFAPGFVLLSDENRWINDIKFPRQMVEQYYREHFENETHIQFPIIYPGDYFIDTTFYKKSHYHADKNDHEIYSDLEQIFSKEIAVANKTEYMTEDEMDKLENKLTYWINKNKSLYNADVIEDSIFSIKFTDVTQNNFFNISIEDKMLVVKRSNNPRKEDRLIITTKAKLLSLNLDKMWGGDILSIGYAIDIEVFEELSLEKNLDIVCVRLITRYPIFKDDVASHAGRVLKYYFSNPSLTNLWINQKIKLRPYVNKYPFNERDHWITYNKCDLCQVCKMPELDFEKL